MPRRNPVAVAPQQVLVDLDEAARVSKFSRAALEEAIRDGELAAVRRRGRVFVTAAALKTYVDHHAEVARALADSEADVRAGRVSGPFETAEDLRRHLHRQRPRRR